MPPHPGPSPTQHDGTTNGVHESSSDALLDFTFCSLNITDCLKFAPHVVRTHPAHAYAFQETSIPQRNKSEARALSKQLNLWGEFTNTDPLHNQPTGGMCICGDSIHKALPHSPLTAKFKELGDTGRHLVSSFDLAIGCPLDIANIYGWQGAHLDGEATQRTSHLLNAIMAEVHTAASCLHYK